GGPGWGPGSARRPPAGLGDQPHAVAGAAALPEVVVARPGEEAGAGHVDMRPRAFPGEVVQELGGVGRPTLAAAVEVLEVGEVGVDVAAVARMEREGPGVVSGRLAGGHDLVAPIGGSAVDAGVEVAERLLHRPGQRGEVDDMRRALATGVPEGVGEHDAPLR